MIKRIVIGVSAALSVALMAEPSEAAISWNLKPSGTGNWDWNIRGVYKWYDEQSGSLPASFYSGFMWSNAADHCIEIETRAGRWFSNPDTRIWVKAWTSAPWQSVNDDFGGTLQSKARIWIRYPVINGEPTQGEYFIKIAPHNSNHSFEDFELVTTRRDLSEAACTTNQTTIPWAKFIGTGSVQTTLVLSPNAR